MLFQKVQSPEPAVHYLAQELNQALNAGKKVFWLVPGGSAAQVAVAVSQVLSVDNLSNLTVTLTDERYGLVGHANANWGQLLTAGFSPAGATLLPVLTGRSIAEETTIFAQNLQKLFDQSDYKVGLFGLGTDGHTAGILPGSPAVASHSLAMSYQAAPFQRITMTPAAIVRLDEAVVYAVGVEKQQALKQLAQTLPITQQPAQALKAVSRLTIFNDQQGEKL